MEPKEVRIGILGGSEVKSIFATSDMTVEQAIEAAGFDLTDKSVHGMATGTPSRAVALSESVNGFDKLFLTTNVKGGC